MAGLAAKKAYIELNSADAFNEVYWSSSEKVISADPAKLTYRKINLEYERIKIDHKCLARKQRPGDLIYPEECETESGLNTLETKLLEAGWLKKSAHRTTEYYHEGLLARVVINTNQESVALEPISEKEAKEFWSDLRAAQAAKNAAAKKSDDFIQSMKQ